MRKSKRSEINLGRNPFCPVCFSRMLVAAPGLYCLLRHGMENALNLLKKALDENVRRFGRVLHESATAVKLFPMPLSTL